MAKINKLTIYNINPAIKANDFWIGSRGDDGKTFNFSAGEVAQFVAALLGLSGNISTGLISVQSITEENLVVDVHEAVYRINGTQYGPISGELTIEAATEEFFRIDIIVGNADGELIHIEGEEGEESSLQPATPTGTVLIGIISLFGSEVEVEIPDTNYGWRIQNNLVYLKRQGNTNPNKIQGGDPVWGVMDDNNTLIKGGPYKGTGSYGDANSYYANPEDISGQPATNTPA